jgi:hypothetical protein
MGGRAVAAFQLAFLVGHARAAVLDGEYADEAVELGLILASWVERAA